MSKILFVSVKPEFVEKIFNGTKTIELRKSSPKVSEGDSIIIYSTSPIMEIVGTCIVKEILKMNPSKMWTKYSQHLGIDKKRFSEYYDGKDLAVGIVLTEKRKFKSAIRLADFRKKFPDFHPPQTYRYLDEADFRKHFLK